MTSPVIVWKLALPLCLLVSSCSHTQYLHKSELKQFQAAHRPAASGASGVTRDQEIRALILEDGSTSRILGDPDIGIEGVGGETRLFRAPVLVEQPDADHVLVRGESVRPHLYAWDDIARVTVEAPDTTPTLALASLGVCVLAVVGVFAVASLY